MQRLDKRRAAPYDDVKSREGSREIMKREVTDG